MADAPVPLVLSRTSQYHSVVALTQGWKEYEGEVRPPGGGGGYEGSKGVVGVSYISIPTTSRFGS